MNIAAPNTKEQLIHFLITHISLGTYDKKFISNVYENNKPLTTNQNELLDKIVLRYSKQLSKKQLKAIELINLPWTKPLIISSPEFTEAHISLVDDVLYIRTPYKKDFILKLKESVYPIVWDRNERLWYTDFCVEILEYVIQQTESHFSQINYCKKIQEIIYYLCEFQKYKCWDPTLVYINNRYYLLASNEIIYNFVQEYLEEITPYSLTKLVRHGVKIDESITHNLTDDDTSLIKFSTEVHPILEADDIQLLVKHLNYIECDCVLINSSIYFSKLLSVESIRYFEDNGITVLPINKNLDYSTKEFKELLNKYKCTVLLSNYMNVTIAGNATIFTDKVCHLVNSKAAHKKYYEVDI